MARSGPAVANSFIPATIFSPACSTIFFCSPFISPRTKSICSPCWKSFPLLILILAYSCVPMAFCMSLRPLCPPSLPLQRILRLPKGRLRSSQMISTFSTVKPNASASTLYGAEAP